MSRITFPITCIVLFLAVCLAVPLISPYFHSPTTNVSVNASTEVLATTENGNVTKEGPFGNPTSPVKVAYIVGVHPWEQYSHDAAVAAIKKEDKSLRYQYYIYHIYVPGGINSDYDTGRMDGQVLAENYVVPDILKGSYQLVMDIHSNKGGEDYYEVSWFLNVPYPDERTQKIADQLKGKIPGITFYDPPLASSPYYVTIPIIKQGVPAIIYEAYAYDSPDTRLALAEQVLKAVDSLNFDYDTSKLA